MSRRFIALSLVAVACLLGFRSHARDLSATDLLDQYAAGKFDEVVRGFDHSFDFDELLKQLRRDGPAWIDAKGPDARQQRRLAAATLALEAARADEWHEWKWLTNTPPQMGTPMKV